MKAFVAFNAMQFHITHINVISYMSIRKVSIFTKLTNPQQHCMQAT